MRADYNPDEGRFLMERALNELVWIRAQMLGSDPLRNAPGAVELADALMNVATEARQLANFMFYIDGGRTYEEFKQRTDEFVGTLGELAARIR